MKLSLQIFICLGLSLTLLSSCMPVRIDYSKLESNADSGKYKTFAFYQMSMVNKTALEPQAKNIEKIKVAIKKELMARNYREENNPDLLVNIGIFIEEHVQTRETNIHDAPMYIGQRSYHWEVEEIEVDRYDEGTVVVDLVDAANQELVWEGAAIGTITQNQDKMETRINEGMKKLFKKFPWMAPR